MAASVRDILERLLSGEVEVLDLGRTMGFSLATAACERSTQDQMEAAAVPFATSWQELGNDRTVECLQP